MRCHWDIMSRVEDLGEAGHELGHDCGEDLVPCCQEQRCRGRILSVFDRFVFFEGSGGSSAMHCDATYGIL